jgi:NAD(P)-dependent dehydrogenase (short-subunit alcohol dehydrogenase family)
MALELKSARPASTDEDARRQVRLRVAEIVNDIRTRGEAAVRSYSGNFDRWEPASFRLSDEEIDRLVGSLPQQVIDDIDFVQDQVRHFATVQRESLLDVEVETLPGVFLGHRHVPVGAVGAYIPGGRYPLTASAHMTIVTAKVAGVPRVVACTPPIHGEIPAATVAAMSMAGADEIYLLGGVQAVASMALGTEFLDRVDLIAGPGNAYVAEAKRHLYGEVGIGEQVSILINNAGIAGPVTPLTEIDPDAWDEVFATNVRGTFLMCHAFLPAMIEHGFGDVINMASVSGKRPLIRRTPYCASKMAVIGLTATLAFEVGPYGVRVNSLSPGPVEGERMDRNFRLEAERTSTTYDEARDAFVNRSALGRMITEDEVGEAVVAMLGMPGMSGADVDLSAGMVA